MIIIDRFEGESAILETDEDMITIPRTELPQEASEGDILLQTESGWQVDAQATQQRRELLAARRHRMLGGGTV